MTLIRAHLGTGMLANGEKSKIVIFSIFRKKTPFCNVNELICILIQYFFFKYRHNDLKQFKLWDITQLQQKNISGKVLNETLTLVKTADRWP